MRANLAALLALTLLVPTVACDTADEADGEVQTLAFTNGMTLESAFRVTLASTSGSLVVGANDLQLTLGFDPNAEDGGMPIGTAKIDFDAYIVDADVALGAEPTVTYEGRGIYKIENVVLEQPGLWTFDFDVSVGEGVHESISVAFDVE
jgi:hypothetical protein